MEKPKGFYPKEANFGRNCIFWSARSGCTYPKIELTGRRSCEGIIDDECLYFVEGRIPPGISQADLLKRKIIPPGEPE